jgi:hypothetical protein
VRSLIAPTVFVLALLVGAVVVAFLCRVAYAVPALRRLSAPLVSHAQGAVETVLQLPAATLAQ